MQGIAFLHRVLILCYTYCRSLSLCSLIA